jgi:hypothetical protein
MQTDDASIDRLVRQLQKSFGVRHAETFPAEHAVTREIALIKVRTDPVHRVAFLAVVSQFEATVVDGSRRILAIAGRPTAPTRIRASSPSISRSPAARKGAGRRIVPSPLPIHRRPCHDRCRRATCDADVDPRRFDGAGCHRIRELGHAHGLNLRDSER